MEKTLLFTGFRSRHDVRFFEKRVNTNIFLRSSKQKIGSTSANNPVIYKGWGRHGQKLCKYQRFSAQTWPKHRYLQCFVPSTFSSHSKNCVNTIIHRSLHFTPQNIPHLRSPSLSQKMGMVHHALFKPSALVKMPLFHDHGPEEK